MVLLQKCAQLHMIRRGRRLDVRPFHLREPLVGLLTFFIVALNIEQGRASHPVSFSIDHFLLFSFIIFLLWEAVKNRFFFFKIRTHYESLGLPTPPPPLFIVLKKLTAFLTVSKTDYILAALYLCGCLIRPVCYWEN